MEEDVYFTINHDGQGKVTEKMSRFISFARHVASRDEALRVVRHFSDEYCDSRHVCWAYMLGPKREEWQLNDNGEPSGTAGKPILGQINSRGLTDVVVVVVRYFGGIKLGTPGLIAAYRAAAALALEDAGRRECFKTSQISFSFPYQSADAVMKIVKANGLETIESSFDNTCRLHLRIRESKLPEITSRLQKIAGLSFEN